jgi:hypothetical protein
MDPSLGPDRWNKTLLQYNFANGSTIEFSRRIRKPASVGARRQVLYINEANNIDFDSYYQLAIRTSQEIYIDFNPTHEFWAHTEVLPEKGCRVPHTHLPRQRSPA